MLPSRLSRVRRVALSLLLLAGPAPVWADAVPDDVCDIAVDTRMSVYVVLVGNAPYQDKRYLTWDDALKLRDVLVSAGACNRASKPKPCRVKLLAAGSYAVLRDGVNFDPYAKLRTEKAARAYAGKLAKVKLCRRVD